MNLPAWNEISSSSGIENWLIRARMQAFLDLADVYLDLKQESVLIQNLFLFSH